MQREQNKHQHAHGNQPGAPVNAPDRARPGKERLAAAGVTNVSLTNFDCVAEVAAETGYIRPEDVRRLIAFRNDPSDESWIGGGK